MTFLQLYTYVILFILEPYCDMVVLFRRVLSVIYIHCRIFVSIRLGLHMFLTVLKLHRLNMPGKKYTANFDEISLKKLFKALSPFIYSAIFAGKQS